MSISNSRHESMYEQTAAKGVNPISRQICSKSGCRNSFTMKSALNSSIVVAFPWFFQNYHKKGVYFDRHKRKDLVEYREQFVQQLHKLDRRCIYDGHEPELLEREKPLIQIHHDGNTFYANADQSHYCFEAKVIRASHNGVRLYRGGDSRPSAP